MSFAAFAVAMFGAVAGVCLPATAPDEPYAIGYFGEPMRGLSPAQQASFDRGYLLFIKTWNERGLFAHNANSCTTCHSVPMPGGSGMSDQALVAVREHSEHTEVVQRRGRFVSLTNRGHARTRRTPPLFGIGILENALRVDLVGRTLRPGFGAFQDVSSLEDFVARAFATELGVSSSRHCASRNPHNVPRTCRPDIADGQLTDVVTYLRYLAPPPRRMGDVSRSATAFQQVGCMQCHQESVTTRDNAPAPLRSIRALAYTDLLRHDLGDGRVRTPPLWGLNSTGPPYMHHGRAQSIEEAIQQHSGDARGSLDLYNSLPVSEREALLSFLRAL